MIPIRNYQRILILEDEGDLCLILEMVLYRKHVVIDLLENVAAATEYIKDMHRILFFSITGFLMG